VPDWQVQFSDYEASPDVMTLDYLGPPVSAQDRRQDRRESLMDDYLGACVGDDQWVRIATILKNKPVGIGVQSLRKWIGERCESGYFERRTIADGAIEIKRT
jgi:hypothetical protein